MDLDLAKANARYTSGSQIARVITEAWVERTMFCPNCGHHCLAGLGANKPVADFTCPACQAIYELKSRKGRFGRTVANGAYAVKQARLRSDTSPNLLLLQYSAADGRVETLLAVPKRFFTESIIEARKPLAAHARRAGWVGSNIHLHLIPNVGRIAIIDGGMVMNRQDVLARWRQTAFLDAFDGQSRGWLLDVLACVERVPTTDFTLDDIYAFDHHLMALHPGNRNVRPKIRQQLQVLRDNGLIEFLGSGRYRKRPLP